MSTINASTLTPPAVIAALRADDWATVAGAPAHEWLARYWRDRIADAVPADVRDAASRYGEYASECLHCLADELATEDITQAVDFITDYRDFADRPVNNRAFIKMMLEALLDWSKWCGRIDIDDARAQDWLRSLLS